MLSQALVAATLRDSISFISTGLTARCLRYSRRNYRRCSEGPLYVLPLRQCSQPPSPSVFGVGPDRLRLIVGLFRALGRNAPGKVRAGWTVGDYSPNAWTSGTSPSCNHTPPNQPSSHHYSSHYSCGPLPSPAVPHYPQPPPCPEHTCLTL